MRNCHTGEHVLVPHARFCACRERRLRVVAELIRQARDHAGTASVLVGVVEADEPEYGDTCQPGRGLRLVTDSEPVQDTSRPTDVGHRNSGAP